MRFFMYCEATEAATLFTSRLHILRIPSMLTTYSEQLDAAEKDGLTSRQAWGSPPAQQCFRRGVMQTRPLSDRAEHKPSTPLYSRCYPDILIMGRRKPFIDKKSATTYSLLYNDSGEAGEDASQSGAAAKAKHVPGRPDHSAIIAQLQNGQEEGPVLQLPEDRRKELVSLGFPDDGYDYLKHLKEGRDEPRTLPEDDPEKAASRDEGRISAACDDT